MVCLLGRLTVIGRECKTSSKLEVKPSVATTQDTAMAQSHSEKLLSVGQVAARSGLSVATLHFYEQSGLISSQRNAGNQRRYPMGVLRRLGVIKTAQRLGISLKEISEALQQLPAQRTPTSADWHKLSTRWRAQLQARIAQLEKLRDQLDGCIGCGCLSLNKCQLRNPGDAAAARGSGAVYLQAPTATAPPKGK